ncbi:hypothetical protein EVAR_50192_1 [Eumeta japonica]|uniref:Uncharacterized protein n=1 Tax=Eumeta variegata TaxID=151549 RepID=A0A4C1X0C0_EUMVA|nr:hypothetical protein EVAR_50192_1 [Eumeta japonica]
MQNVCLAKGSQTSSRRRGRRPYTELLAPNRSRRSRTRPASVSFYETSFYICDPSFRLLDVCQSRKRASAPTARTLRVRSASRGRIEGRTEVSTVNTVSTGGDTDQLSLPIIVAAPRVQFRGVGGARSGEPVPLSGGRPASSSRLGMSPMALFDSSYRGANEHVNHQSIGDQHYLRIYRDSRVISALPASSVRIGYGGKSGLMEMGGGRWRELVE